MTSREPTYMWNYHIIGVESATIFVIPLGDGRHLLVTSDGIVDVLDRIPFNVSIPPWEQI